MNEPTTAVTFASFEDIADERFAAVTVATPYNAVYHFRLGLVSYVEFQELYWTVLDDPVPSKRRGTEVEADHHNPEHLKKQANAASLRKLLIVADALVRGGMAIPGDDLRTKADTLARKASGAVINALWAFLKDCYEGGEAALDQHADHFRLLQALKTGDNGALSAFTRQLEQLVTSLATRAAGVQQTAAETRDGTDEDGAGSETP